MDGNPYAKYISESSAIPVAPSENPYSKYTQKAPDTTSDSELKKDDSFVGSMKRGTEESALGVGQTLLDLGIGHILPQYVDGKIVFGMDPEQIKGTKENMSKRQEQLEEEGKGTGIKGFAGEVAGDPLNLIGGPEFKGLRGAYNLMAKGGLQGAISSFLAPTTNPNKTVTDRGINAGITAPISTITGGLISKTGEKLLGKNTPAGVDMTKPSEVYKLAQKMGLKFTGKESAQQVYDAVENAMKSKVNELADKITPGASTSEVSGLMTNLATSKVYAAALAKNEALYKVANDLGAKETAPVEGLTDALKAQIDDMEKDAPYQAANPKFGTTINMLKKIHEHLTNGGDEALKEDAWSQIQRLLSEGGEKKTPVVTGNQLIEMDQALNENFGRTGGKGAGGRALTELQGKIQGAIQGMSPEFSKAYQTAKNDFRQNIVQNFRENPTLNKYWNEDDYYAVKALQKGVSLSPELKTRANSMLDKIKTFDDLSEMKQHLDPATYDSVRAAKFIQLMNKAGLDAAKIADDKNYMMLEKAVGNKPEDLAVLNSIKTFSEEMTRRGLQKDITPVQLEQSDKLIDRAFRTVFSFLTGHKVYGFRHAFEAISNDTPKGIQSRVVKFSKDVAKGAPKPVYKPGVIPNVITKGAATKEGKEVDVPIPSGEDTSD